MATNNADNFSNPITVSQGGLGVSTLTAYSPLCGGTTTTGAIQNASSGIATSNYVLTSQGSSALPAWKANTAGIVLLQTQTISSSTASVSFNSTYITSTYTSYLLVCRNVTVTSASGASPFTVVFSTNNGTGYLSSNYQSGYIAQSYSSSMYVNSNTTSKGYVSGCSATAAADPINGEVFFSFPQSAIASYIGRFFTQELTSVSIISYGNNSGTTTINNIKMAYSANNIATGVFSLYGIPQ